MDPLHLILTSPPVKRLVRALVDRALVAGVTVLMAWLRLSPTARATFNAEALAVVNEIAPVIVAALFTWLTYRKSQRTELTIETARVLPAFTPRATIDATADLVAKGAAAPLTPPIGARDLDLDLTQRVPPGTVDRTD